MPTAKRAKSSKKTSKRATGKAKATGKGLEQMIKQAMSDKKFIEQLEKDPAAALRENGYAVTPRLVKAIKGVDFKAFRAVPKRVGVRFC